MTGVAALEVDGLRVEFGRLPAAVVRYRWVISIQEQTPTYQATPFDSK